MTFIPSTQKTATKKLAAILLVSVAVSFSSYAQSDLDPQSHARLPYLKKAEADTEGHRVWEIFGGSGSLNGPLAFAAYNPEVGDALLDLHDAAIGGTLDAHARELAIMVACRETNYNLEWNGHMASAKRAGVSDKVLDIVRKGDSLKGVDEKDATIIRLGRELYGNRKVDSATFKKVVDLWGARGAMDMVAVMNTYAVSGFFAIAVDEHAADGAESLPPMK